MIRFKIVLYISPSYDTTMGKLELLWKLSHGQVKHIPDFNLTEIEPYKSMGHKFTVFWEKIEVGFCKNLGLCLLFKTGRTFLQIFLFLSLKPNFT